jgi:hypothetical protein
VACVRLVHPAVGFSHRHLSLMGLFVADARDLPMAASKRERADVATVCNDSVACLYPLAGQHRYASALMAARIEAQTCTVAARSAGCFAMVPREIPKFSIAARASS